MAEVCLSQCGVLGVIDLENGHNEVTTSAISISSGSVRASSLALSRFIACKKCHSTVLSDRRSLLAIADEDNPCVTKFKTSHSRSVMICDGGGGP